MPRVSVRNSVRKPMSPRAGTTTSMRIQPEPWFTSASVRPFRSAKSCVSTPRYSSGASTETRSTGSCTCAVDLPRHDLRLADRELESLAAHLLDENRQLELAAALHLPRVRRLGRQDAQRDVADELGAQPVLQQSRGDLVAREARERRGVDADRHRERGLVDCDHGKRPRVVRIGERLADRHLGEPRDGDDLSRPGLGRPRRGRAPRSRTAR